jgi:hypothetical protein
MLIFSYIINLMRYCMQEIMQLYRIFMIISKQI